MDYESILKEIKPNQEEIDKVHNIVMNIITTINEIAKKENIPGEAKLVGSIAKDTWLSGNSDIDIFINFPLYFEEKELKEKGLFLAYETSKIMGGKAEEHYASHPYVITNINGYNIDIVPCYNIKNSNELKSAVDRTILHTNYMLNNLKEEQKDEVLLLKKFMKEVGVYGSEFKTGGFAGYLCEILIIKYGTFEKTLKKAMQWKKGEIIDLENYGTGQLFNDSLIAIDPTDKNRNVGAALTNSKMIEFIASSRNFIKEPKTDYFKPLKKDLNSINSKNIINKFKDRESKTYILSFQIPKIPIDNLYPQIQKTAISLKEKLIEEEFNTTDIDYWSDEDKIAIILIELDTWNHSKYQIHEGPKIWNKKACDEFLAIHGDKCYLKEEYWVFKKPRKNRTAEDFINNIFKEKNISTLKIGKNLKKSLIGTYNLDLIESFLSKSNNNSYNNNNNNNNNDNNYKLNNENSKDYTDFLNFLDDYLTRGQKLKR